MSDDDGGRHLVGLHLKFVSEHEIENCGWQTCEQNQRSALQALQRDEPEGQKYSRDSDEQNQHA